ncbi:hypothetical protein ACOTVJ_02950 [Aliarcobacter butzleri]
MFKYKYWEKFKKICKIRTIKKNEYAFDMYDKVNAINFVYSGLFRTFIINEKGEEYTKNFYCSSFRRFNCC